MKIRDLDKGRYVIVYDMGKSEYSEGMTVVGQVVGDLEFNEEGKNEATIESLPFHQYKITDDNYFDYWEDYIESKTERVSEKGITVDKKHFDNIDEEHFYHKARVEAMHNAIKKTRGYVNEYLSNDVQQRKRNDMVNSPSHYMLGNHEVKDIVSLVADKYHKGSVAHNIASALEYQMRAPEKNGLEDIKKARKCLDFAIENWDVK